jgi:hypothetical protein
MSSDLVVKANTELATLSNGDTLAAIVEKDAPQYAIGDRLWFTKGDYCAGATSEPVAVGTQFTAAPNLVLAGFVNWHNNKPCAIRLVRGDSGEPLPRRSDLGDSDPSKWETDLNGNPRDPWQETRYLPLMDQDGRLFTFTTNSSTGRRSVGNLLRRYQAHCKRHPDLYPIIKLGVGSFQHSDKSIGKVKLPEFELSGYEPTARFLAALAAAGFYVGEPPEGDDGSSPTSPPLHDEVNDAVPF